MPTWEEIIDAELTNDRKEGGRMCSGIAVLRQGRAQLFMLPNDGFRTLSSGFTNGGFMDGPLAVVNISGMGGKAEADYMSEGLDTCDKVSMAYAEKLGLNPERVVFQTTSASMDNAVIGDKITSGGIDVSVSITAGIKHNAGRSGDPAVYDESEAGTRGISGTVIMILAIDADLSDAAMLQAMLLATEAKSCVIQEMQVRSRYSQGLATGSGTDQVVIISNKSSSEKIETLDRTSSMARSISDVISDNLRTAFAKQSGMVPASQWEPLEQLARIGVDADRIRMEMCFDATMRELEQAVERLRTDRFTTTLASAVINIHDDIARGLATQEEGMALAKDICTKSILEENSDPVVALRLRDMETIPDLLSYVAALKVMDVVVSRRGANGQ